MTENHPDRPENFRGNTQGRNKSGPKGKLQTLRRFVNQFLEIVSLSPILHVSVAPLGLELVLRFLPGVPFGHPRLAYKPAQQLTVAPSGG
jgi:hypothetical protein